MPSLGITPPPEGCTSRAWMLMPEAAPVSGVFPAGPALNLLEIRVQAIQL